MLFPFMEFKNISRISMGIYVYTFTEEPKSEFNEGTV